jgi:RNA polymerase sigma-70 factor (family 1)
MEDEKDIILRLKHGDSYAFTKLYNNYVKKIFSFSLNIVKSPDLAHDITHDVFVKIWQNAPQLDVEKSFQSYLFTIARNHIFNLIKRAKLETALIEQMLQYAVVSECCTENTIELNESIKIVNQAIDALPPQRKLIFDLCKNEGLTYNEVATQLNISSSTVNSQMVKAMKSIKDFLLLNGTLSMFIAYCYFHSR